MNKKTKLKLNETLNKALEPPMRKNLNSLDALLSQYDSPDQPQAEPRPEADQIAARKKVFPLKKTVVPERDFNKRANSLERDALPARLFPGASKAIYDALYLRTLGAVVPTNAIQATRRQIMDWSGIKNIKTINAHLKKLEDNKLVKRSNFIGEHSGNYYEIYLPNESGLASNLTQSRPRPDPDQKMGPDQAQKMVWVGPGNRVENKGTYEFPKTSLKTIENDDDDAFAAMLAIFRGMSEKISGKNPPKNQAENWKDLAELLKMELEIAAARTKSVSNVPAFLTEHLRRRLLHQSTTSEAAETKFKTSKSLKVGKQGSMEIIETYQAEPLSKEGRETVLKTMREYIGKGEREFVMNLKDTYAREDWQWLNEQLTETENNEQGNADKEKPPR